MSLMIALLSVDKMYVIKTMTTEEIEEMHHLLKQVSRWLRNSCSDISLLLINLELTILMQID